MLLAVLSPFVARQHGTERSLAEIVEGLAMRHGHEIHLFSLRVADVQVTPFRNRAQDSGQRALWHRGPVAGVSRGPDSWGISRSSSRFSSYDGMN